MSDERGERERGRQDGEREKRKEGGGKVFEAETIAERIFLDVISSPYYNPS